ncbi:radical SAM family heme chaperone HemW [Jannaschia sp. W003]|uniref:radical SAM family heme chaperone HemW n=1 Tax=Jannaschia sp. W003 TaxID=2867012 RepID=UPI0021A58EFD|nr:radical SAM family heme chaperone HemW [Jannaschia sp. W003]UWQ21995.1 radical SAM family heme chaperone HemW [Jannaschia sp. W003]
MDGGFGLYVHWPFCEAKCPYCDFNSHVAAGVDHDRWRRALVADLRTQAERAPDRILGSIFFGGGTPSRMVPETTAAVIDEARRLFRCANDLEVTLEANPTSVEVAKLGAFAEAGVTRVSIGVQALRDRDLRALGRTHDVAEALRALETARARFDRVSFDLIYARQDQTMVAWAEELREAVALGPDHLSLYQLTIEPGTAFHRRHEAGGLRGLPDGDAVSDMYFFTNDFLTDHGLPAYEVSNHATPGAECRHNLAYWRAGDWLGVGPGAHGRIGTGAARRATEAVRMPDAWLAQVETKGHGLDVDAALDGPDAHAEEYLMTGFRLAEGLSQDRLGALGLRLDDTAVADLAEEGLLMPDGNVLRPTLRGRAVADAMALYLADRSIPALVSASQSLSS